MPWAHLPQKSEEFLDCLELVSRSSSCTEKRSLDVGSGTHSGNRYGSLNQDYAAVQEMYTAEEIPRDGKQVYIATICDGHGILGDKAALFAGKAIVRTLYSSAAFRNKNLSKMPVAELEAEMKSIFARGHQAACSVYESPPQSVEYPRGAGNGTMLQFSLVNVNGLPIYRCNGKGPEKMLECGCTATVAVIQGRRLCLADVGDSQAVLGSYDDLSGESSAEVVTERHWGWLNAEASRIRQQFSHCTRVLEDGYLRVIDGPWAGYELSVTRALGHKNLERHGVISEPYVVVRDLEDHHCCLVLASDGVWDVMTPHEVVNHVIDSAAEGKSASEAAAALVQHAVALGMSGPQAAQDNTSAVVIFT